MENKAFQIRLIRASRTRYRISGKKINAQPHTSQDMPFSGAKHYQAAEEAKYSARHSRSSAIILREA